jgi:metal-responsive CopG/Arc/MetJ family transcriptional regulator
MLDGMAKKEETKPIPIRLPASIIARLESAAAKKYESRAGLASRIIIEWLEQNEPAKRAKER